MIATKLWEFLNRRPVYRGKKRANDRRPHRAFSSPIDADGSPPSIRGVLVVGRCEPARGEGGEVAARRNMAGRHPDNHPLRRPPAC